MATIWWEQPVAAPAERAWAALRCVDKPHQLFAPVLVDGSMAGDLREVTFANGLVVQERIISVDEERRRVAYAVIGEMFEHHSASMQILPAEDGDCRFVWISDFLPDSLIEVVQPLVEQGSAALAATIESGKAPG